MFEAIFPPNLTSYGFYSVGPSMVTQPPPPYYPSSSLENKALEHSLDLALDDGTKGHHVYAAQNGYGYHGALPGHQHHGPPQTHGINGGECELLSLFFLSFFLFVPSFPSYT